MALNETASSKPKAKPKAKPYDPYAPAYPTAAAMANAAGRRADQDIAGLVASLPTEARLQGDSAAQRADLDALSQALSRQLQGNQLATVNMAGAVPTLATQAFGDATQGANSAIIGAGGQAVGGVPKGLGVVAALGAQMSNALGGGVQAAQRQGQLDQQASIRSLDQALKDRAAKAFEIRAQRPKLVGDYLSGFQDDALQRAVARGNEELAYSTLGLNRDKAQADALNDAQRLAQDQSQFDAKQASTAAKTADASRLAWAEYRRKRDADRKRGTSTPDKERRDILLKAADLARTGRAGTTTVETPGSPESTRTTGQTKYSIVVSWMVPSTDGISPPVPGSKTMTITAPNWETARKQAESAYGQYAQVSASKTGETPVTEKVAAVPGTSQDKRVQTDDQVRGDVYNFLRLAGFSGAEAARYAKQIVPEARASGGGSQGPPTQADAGDR